jgi:hypothetical protein
MGKTQSKFLAERHDRGTAGERQRNGMVCVNPPKTSACAGHPSSVKLIGVLQLGVLSKIRDFDVFEDIILSLILVNASGQHP